MKSESVMKSEEVSPELERNITLKRNLRVFAAISITLALLLSPTVLAEDFCSGTSAIDQPPFFVDQSFSDILSRSPDAKGEAFWISKLEALNTNNCLSATQSSSFGNCEVNNQAEITLGILSSPESTSRNGALTSNTAFVTVLYKTLLRRAPDSPGLKAHLATLAARGSRSNVISTFLSSAEYRHRFMCYAGTRDYLNLGINGHPIAQPAYSETDGVSFDDQLRLVQNAGAQWYRFDVGAPNTGADFNKTDDLLKKAQAHGIKLLPILFASIDRAHDSPGAIYTKSYDGAFKFVTHYKSSIHVWELSNEEDVYSISGAAGDQITDYDAHKYGVVAALLKGLSDGVRAADRNAVRIINFAGWLHTGFFQRVEDDHIPYDIVGIHWYQGMGEITCPGQALPCPARLQHFNVIRRLQTITHGKPMWVTETNYTPLPSNSPEMNAARKEKYLSAALQTYMNSPSVYPFQVVMVYELLDEPNLQAGGVTQTQMGMFSVKPGSAKKKYVLGDPKPEYQVLRNLSGR